MVGFFCGLLFFSNHWFKIATMINKILGGLALGYAVKALNAARVGSNIIVNYSVLGLKWDNNQNAPVLTITVQLTNPTESSATINSISGELNYKNNRIGTLVYLNTIELKPRTTTKFIVPIVFNLADVVTNFVYQNRTLKRQVSLKLNIFSSVGKISQNFDFVL